MIYIETKLKKIPNSCTKCKYSYNTKESKFCPVAFYKGMNVPIQLVYVPDINNYCYVKPECCPLVEVKLEHYNKK